MSESKTLTERITALQRERAGLERTFRAQPYPESFRRRAVELHHELALSDLTEREIASRLGLAINSLCRWVRSATPSVAPSPVVTLPSAPMPITVVETQTAALRREPSPLPARPSSPGVTLVSPQGWRIENLDLEQALDVLERLGVRAPC